MEAYRFETTTRSPEDTQRIGRALGAHAGPGHIYLLLGELGAGKTCFAQGVLWGLGVDEYARSPSFVLVAQYQGRLTMYHIDLYRLDTADEVYDLGLEEYLCGDGVCVVEWADRDSSLLSQDHIKVRIVRLGESTRRLTLSTSVPEYASVIEAVKSSVPGK